MSTKGLHILTYNALSLPLAAKYRQPEAFALTPAEVETKTYGELMDCEKPRRLERIAEALSAFTGVAVIQEADDRLVDLLYGTNGLNQISYVKHAPDGNWGTAVFLCNLPPIEAAYSFERVGGRVVISVELVLSNGSFHIDAVHLTGYDRSVFPSADALLPGNAQLEAALLDRPDVLCGDFNRERDGPGLEDFWAKIAGAGLTVHTTAAPASIDFVCTRDPATVLEGALPELFDLSDHRPVVVCVHLT